MSDYYEAELPPPPPCKACVARRKARNPWRTTASILQTLLMIMVPLLMVSMIVGYVMVVRHGYSIGAFDKVETTIMRTRNPGYEAFAVLGGFGLFLSGIGIIFYIGWLKDKWKEKARDWERKQNKKED